MKLKFLFVLILSGFVATNIYPQQDSIRKEKKNNALKNYWNSFIHGNVDRTFERKIDISYAVAPSYTREGSFGVGGMATGLYRLDRRDSIMQPSDITLTGNASINGFYTLTANGNNHFKGNKARLSYSLTFARKTLNFWGISYEGCSNNPLSEYTRQQIKWESNYVFKVSKQFYIGAAFNLNYTDLSEIKDLSYLEGQKQAYFFTGAGVSLQYDTRDFILNPKKGIYIMFKEVIYPEFSGSFNKTLFSTNFIFDIYQKIWSGGIIAGDIYGQFNSKNTPWTLREELGSNGFRMRGYYGGRYIDCNQLTEQLELRQHIFNRLGCVAWVGAGSVFPEIKKFDWSGILPNYGLGLRIEFKHNVNARIDYGFGKNTGGFVFNFAEAF